MTPFTYARAHDAAEAVRLGGEQGAKGPAEVLRWKWNAARWTESATPRVKPNLAFLSSNAKVGTATLPSLTRAGRGQGMHRHWYSSVAWPASTPSGVVQTSITRAGPLRRGGTTRSDHRRAVSRAGSSYEHPLPATSVRPCHGGRS
jgi:hypothetical protein